MATTTTRADSIQTFLTGASSHKALQADPNASLGNFMSSFRANSLTHNSNSFTMGALMAMNTQTGVSTENGVGTGTITATGVDTLTWTPPGGSVGPAVTILNGEIKVVEGSDPNKFIVILRSNATDLTGTRDVIITQQGTTVHGLDDVSTAEQSAGDTEFRCVALEVVASTQIKGIKVFVDTLGSQQTSDTTQLGASGAGSIVTTGSFSTWPNEGYCKIADSSDVEQEIVYYESRTATTLTVPANGRALLGTSASAGAATDKIDAIPGIALGLDAPTSQSSGSFVDNTGVGEGTAPGGVTFSTPLTAAEALDIGDLNAGNIYAVWIKREIPAGATAATGMVNKWHLEFDAA